MLGKGIGHAKGRGWVGRGTRERLLRSIRVTGSS